MLIEFVPVKYEMRKDGKHVAEVKTDVAVRIEQTAKENGDSVVWHGPAVVMKAV